MGGGGEEEGGRGEGRGERGYSKQEPDLGSHCLGFWLVVAREDVVNEIIDLRSYYIVQLVIIIIHVAKSKHGVICI